MSLTKQDLEAIKGIVEHSLDYAITHRIKPMIDAAVEELRLQTAAGFSGVDERFALVDARFEQIDKRFEQVDARFEQVDKRFGQLEKRAGSLEKDVKHIKADIIRINGELHIVNKRFDRLEKQEHTNDAHFEEHGVRIHRLEKHTGLSPA
jgi:septal ring factor EnvC (AmiA/AmiB activator)